MAVPFLLCLTACAADNGTACTDMWVDGKVGAQTAHELSLNLKIRGCGFCRPTRTIVKRHKLALKFFQTAVYKFLS